MAAFTRWYQLARSSTAPSSTASCLVSLSKLLSPDAHESERFVGPIELRYVEGRGRGLFATQHIAAGDVIIANRPLVMEPLISTDIAATWRLACSQLTQADMALLQTLRDPQAEETELQSAAFERKQHRPSQQPAASGSADGFARLPPGLNLHTLPSNPDRTECLYANWVRYGPIHSRSLQAQPKTTNASASGGSGGSEGTTTTNSNVVRDFIVNDHVNAYLALASLHTSDTPREAERKLLMADMKWEQLGFDLNPHMRKPPASKQTTDGQAPASATAAPAAANTTATNAISRSSQHAAEGCASTSAGQHCRSGDKSSSGTRGMDDDGGTVSPEEIEAAKAAGAALVAEMRLGLEMYQVLAYKHEDDSAPDYRLLDIMRWNNLHKAVNDLYGGAKWRWEQLLKLQGKLKHNGVGASDPALAAIGANCRPSNHDTAASGDASASSDERWYRYGLLHKPHLVLCPLFSLLNHSCAPNTAHLLFNGISVVRATRDIAPGEELTYAYLHPWNLGQPAKARQAVLRRHWGFDCRCGRCTAEEKLDKTAQAALQAATDALEQFLKLKPDDRPCFLQEQLKGPMERLLAVVEHMAPTTAPTAATPTAATPIAATPTADGSSQTAAVAARGDEAAASLLLTASLHALRVYFYARRDCEKAYDVRVLRAMLIALRTLQPTSYAHIDTAKEFAMLAHVVAGIPMPAQPPPAGTSRTTDASTAGSNSSSGTAAAGGRNAILAELAEEALSALVAAVRWRYGEGHSAEFEQRLWAAVLATDEQ